MSRFTAKCKLCAWTEKGTGTYDQHFRALRHVQAQHPADYAVLEAGIARIRQISSQLNEQFGHASPMVRVV